MAQSGPIADRQVVDGKGQDLLSHIRQRALGSSCPQQGENGARMMYRSDQ